MEPIEKQIEERKALMQQWAEEIERLTASKAGVSERQALEIDVQIGMLGYKINCGVFALQDLEALAAEGPSPKRKRPPLPKARRLGVVERQRIEQEERARLRAAIKPSMHTEIHVYVGRMTDEQGNPRIQFHITSKRRSEDDA